MPPKAPSWWYGESGLWPILFSPAALIWDAATRLRWMLASPARSRLPVVCIGNPIAGGAGKTPAALTIARLLLDDGQKPVFLTRGYGGTTAGPHLVDRNVDTAASVGDEALLLARVAPTIVSGDRREGARLAEEIKASVIIMDDGFLNPGLVKDYTLLVIDRAMGIGNGWVMPSGPLRAGLGFQLRHAHGVVALGQGDRADRVLSCAREMSLPILEAELMPRDDAAWIKSKPVIAYAGIGYPEKFFMTLESLEADVAERHSFPDHHPYSEGDADRLLRQAKDLGAQLVTTEKDFVRLTGTGKLERLRKATKTLPVRLRFRDRGKAKRSVMRALGAR